MVKNILRGAKRQKRRDVQKSSLKKRDARLPGQVGRALVSLSEDLLRLRGIPKLPLQCASDILNLILFLRALLEANASIG
eukprot:5104557-Pyramimonas_sp.AAC.1